MIILDLWKEIKLKCLLEFLKPSCRRLFQSIKRAANMTNTVTHYIMILLEYFGLIHTDVWGIALSIAHSYHKYFITFIDEYSPFTWIYFFHAKLKSLVHFKNSLHWLRNQFSKSIKIPWSDSRGNMSFTNSKTLYKLRAYFKHVWLNWVSGPILTVTRLLEDYVLWFEALESRSHTEGLEVLPEIPRAENVEWIICWTSELGWGVQAMWAVQTV